jgi:hypothetical protein
MEQGINKPCKSFQYVMEERVIGSHNEYPPMKQTPVAADE